MEFGRGIQPPKQNSYQQIQGPWMPTTTSKPHEQTNRPPSQPLWLNSGVYSTGIAQENAHQNTAVAPSSAATAGMQQFNPSGSADRVPDLQSWTAAMAPQTQVSSLDPHMEALRNAAARSRRTPQSQHHLLSSAAAAARMQGGNNGANLWSPISHMQNNGSSNQQQQQNPAAILVCPNQAFWQGTAQSSNITRFPQQIPHCGFPIPYHAPFNHSTPAQTIGDVVTNGTISFQPAHITLDQGKRVQANHTVEVSGLSANGKLVHGNENVDSVAPSTSVAAPAKDAANPSDNQGLLESMIPSHLVPSTPNKEIHNSSNREALGENLPAATLSTPAKEIHGPEEGREQGIDLNKTPQQKPKRRKHRPKVIREDKPKRTPKPVTPNQANNKEGPSGKRKYVRKAATKTSVSPANAQETIISNGRTSVGSSKRHLDFSSESTAGHTGTVQVLQYAPNSSTGINHTFGSKPTSHAVAQGLKAVAGNLPVETAIDLNHSITQSQDRQISLPSNSNLSQTIAREDPPMRNMESLGSWINIHMDYARMHHNVHANEIDSRINPASAAHDNPSSIRLLNSLPLINYNHNNANSRSHETLRESSQTKRASKRGFNLTVNESHLCPADLREKHSSSMEAQKRKIQHNECYGKGGSPDMNFQNNNKKMRTDTMNNEVTSNLPPPVTLLRDSVRHATATTAGKHITNQLALPTRDGRIVPLCDPMETIKKPQNGAWTVSGMNSQFMTGTHNRRVPGNSREVFSYNRGINLNEPQAPVSWMGVGNIESSSSGRLDRPDQTDELASSVKMAVAYNDGQQSNIFCRPQAQMETPGVDRYAKMKTIGSTKELVHPVYSISFIRNQSYLQEQALVYAHHQSCIESRVTTPVKKPVGLTVSPSKDRQPRNSKTVPISSSHNCQSQSSIQQRSVAGSTLPMIAPHVDTVDEIVRRLGSLNINSSSNITAAQPERALVTYEGDKNLILYQGPFDKTKKRHPRAKVDLDPETDRVWKLLMWKEASDGTEGMDAAKEKWWEEERRVFRGRADSFIARMHLVQGDRRFSPWKGSVVDSVIGVFLTQNVSDQLSSSAFMALAARFPLQPRSTRHDGEGKSTSAEEHDVVIQDSNNQQSKISAQNVIDRGPMRKQELASLEEKEIASSNESFGSNTGACTADNRKSNHTSASQIGLEICHESSENRTDAAFTMTKNACLIGVENGKAMEYAVSSQVSVISSQNSTESIVQAADTIGSCSESNSETENIINQFDGADFNYSTSFMDLLQMEGTNMFTEFYVNEHERISSKENCDGLLNQHKDTEHGRKISPNGVECLNLSGPSSSTNRTHYPQARQEFKGIPGNCSSSHHLCIGRGSASVEQGSVEFPGGLYFASTASGITEIKDNCGPVERTDVATEYSVAYEVQRKQFSNGQTTLKGDFCGPISKHPVYSSPTSVAKPYSHLDAAESSTLVDKQTVNVRNIAEPNLADEVHSSNMSKPTTKNDLKERRGTSRADKKRAVDWDSLRKNVCPDGPKKGRSSDTMDSADWEAVRCADVNEIAKTIRERGMSNMLSERIKDFLNRLVREHGSIDLEWLRDVPPDKAKDYLLSIRGLGLKSVECVRLLTLHNLAFPVDTNVGRICVRLGWVPLQPLPESLQLHLLELYPLLETIQKYLWPRLCTLDQRTLYELHYQMITFGKVFCTKHKPNCNACPMRAECKHFASAFASARLALPGPEEKRLVNSVVPAATEQDHKLKINLMSLPPPEESSQSQATSKIIQCEPIIEEPATPEPECIDTLESAIEDAFWTEDPDEIPTIKLNIEEFTQNVQNYIQENGELQDVDMSKALVALTQEAASIPMPKLKNISRLRTEHQVYELPDSHPLLAELDRREPDDPCPYLLAIWTPGETAQSIKPPEISCTSQNSGNLCSKKTCFACNSIREANAQTVRGTLLIPCRTAMRGSFPLNGTYFQVNEVFADHDSSINPIDVPRSWIWNLPRRTVCFGTSISTIFRGLTTEGIQQCFWRGFVCVRGFDQKTRAPRPLMARLHFPASKLVGTKKTPAMSE